MIVIGGIDEAFTDRLAQAVRSLKVGPAEDPDTDIPAVISAEARERILEYHDSPDRKGGSWPGSTSARWPTGGTTSAR